jgi:hypothetical protein
MGTGIVSVALWLNGDKTIARILLAITGLMWATLALLAGARAARDRAGFWADAQTPPALTAVAGTAVLGTGLTALGWSWAGIALLVVATGVGAATNFARVWVWIALAVWAVVFAAMLRGTRTVRRPRPAPGARAPRMPRG